MSPAFFIAQLRRLLPRGGPRPCGGTLPGVPLLAAALLAVALLGAGCGYRMETPTLPGNARSLGIGQIRNLTYTGELDVRLKNALRNQLLRNPGFLLTSPERSELVLEISLDELKVSRPLDVADTELSALVYRLRGTVTVYRMGPEKLEILKKRITAGSRLDFDIPVLETPAVRDEIRDDVIVAFAVKVEEALYQHF